MIGPDGASPFRLGGRAEIEADWGGGWARVLTRRGGVRMTMASTRKLMAGSKSENMELACKVLVRGYEFEARDLEMEFSSFGKVASISRSSELVQRAKPNVQKFVGEEDDQIPRAPRGLNPVNWRDPAGRESTTLAYRQKAIAASLSLAMSRFSDADLLILAKSSSLIKINADEELALEGEPVNHILIVLRGIFEFIKTEGNKEVRVGTLAGAGQVIGEMGLLRDGASSTSHFTITAETAGKVVVVPSTTFAQLMTKYSSVLEELEANLGKRQHIIEALAKRKTATTAMLHGDEVACLADVVLQATFDAGEDLGGTNKAVWCDCVSAVVVSGSVEAFPSPPPPENSNKTPRSTRRDAAVQAQAPHLDASAFAASGRAIELGEGVESAFAGECVQLDRMDKGQVKAGEGGLVVCLLLREDFEQLVATNYELRAYVEQWSLAAGKKKKGLGGWKEQAGLCKRLPWAKNQEQRIGKLAVTRQRGLASWRGEESGPEDPGMGAYYWNRAVREVELWHDILSFSEVSVSMNSALEADRAVAELKVAWKRRFSVAAHAGTSLESQQLRKFTWERMIECEGNYAAAEMWVQKMEEHGLEMDAKMQRELLKMYNQSDPIQIERGFNAIRALVKAGGLKPGLLQETVVAWCKSGHTNSAEEMMQFAMDSGIQVPDTAFSSLMLGRVHERHIEGAHKSLGMMWERKLVPDVQVINRLVALYVEKKQIDRAIEILWEMESSGEDEGPQPDLATYLCVAGGLAAAGDAKRLEAVLAKMPRGTKLPENVKSDLVVEALCISGDVDAAEELARGQPWRSEETVSMIAAGWSRKGEADKAANVIISLAFAGMDPAKITLQKVTKRWHIGKRTQFKGYEIDLDSDLAHAAAQASLMSVKPQTSFDATASYDSDAFNEWGQQLQQLPDKFTAADQSFDNGESSPVVHFLKTPSAV